MALASAGASPPSVLVFPDLCGSGRLRRTYADALARQLPGNPCTVVDWLASPTVDAKQTVCVGIGAAARAALSCAAAGGSPTVLAWAPSGGLGEAFTPPGPGARVHIITSPDTVVGDLALAARCREAGALVRTDHTDIPYPLLASALRISGRMKAAVEAVLEARPPPRGLTQAWRRALAHTIDVDLDNAYSDARDVLHIPGSIRNDSDAELDLALLGEEGIGVGGILVGPDGAHTLVRSAFSTGALAPGEAAPFRLRLSGPALDNAVELRITLICEGYLPLDVHGLPAARLALRAPAEAGA